MSFLVSFLNFTINILIILIFIRVILSWLRLNPENMAVKFLHEVTEPMLAPFRKFTTAGMFDFSPIIAMIILELIRQIILIFLK